MPSVMRDARLSIEKGEVLKPRGPVQRGEHIQKQRFRFLLKRLKYSRTTLRTGPEGGLCAPS